MHASSTQWCQINYEMYGTILTSFYIFEFFEFFLSSCWIQQFCKSNCVVRIDLVYTAMPNRLEQVYPTIITGFPWLQFFLGALARSKYEPS